MSQRTALVLGATGMVGEPVARQLKADGWKVYGAARMSNPDDRERLEEAGIEPVRFDVTCDLPKKLPDDVEVVFLELWDPKRPELTWPINFYGVGEVVERYAGKANFINGCSINVYGDQPGMPAEDSPCRPTSDYGRSRYAQERLIDYFCQRSGSQAVHVRYAHANSVTRGKVRRYAEAILAGESLGANPDAKTQIIALEDFVRVTIGALDHFGTPSAAVNCCHPRVWTERELASDIRRRLGKGKVVFDREQGGAENSVIANPARMLAWFGEPTVSLSTILERVVKDLILG